METVLIYAIVVALVAVVAVLAVGITGLARGTSDPRRSQRLMRARVVTQGIALILVVALFALRWMRAG